MGRSSRHTPGGFVYHVLNRGVARRTLFRKPADYLAFERIIDESLRSRPIRICAYCLMPNHWHFVMWPEHDDDLSLFMQLMTNTHVKRWKQYYGEIGFGHMYQGRFKSFPVETDEYFYQVVRYVERNPLRANLVAAPADWQWSSLARRTACEGLPLLARAVAGDWPVSQPRASDWLSLVSESQTEEEIAVLRQSVKRGRPFGSESWVATTAETLGLESTMRSRGRPRKGS